MENEGERDEKTTKERVRKKYAQQYYKLRAQQVHVDIQLSVLSLLIILLRTFHPLSRSALLLVLVKTNLAYFNNSLIL